MSAMRLLEKQNGVTRVTGVKTEKELYGAAIESLSTKKFCTQIDQADLWHCHFGHVSKDKVDRTLSNFDEVLLVKDSNNSFFSKNVDFETLADSRVAWMKNSE